MRWPNPDRNGAIEASLARAIDLSHSAGTERRKDFVRTELGAEVRAIRALDYSVAQQVAEDTTISDGLSTYSGSSE